MKSTDLNEPDPFSVFETPAGVIAFLCHEGSEDDVRKVLEMLHHRADETERCEFWEDIAAELKDAGLNNLADMVLPHAAQYPSGLDDNPYQKGTRHWFAWRNNWALWHNRRHLLQRTSKRQKNRKLH